MTDLLVLCPTRGRPTAAREAFQAFTETAQLDSSEILFIVDDDDPELAAYRAESLPVLELAAPGNMVAALNDAALWASVVEEPTYIGFIGDDHRFRTVGWDRIFTDLLGQRGWGMVYGNDTIRTDGDIPTQIVMSMEIVKALGWFGLPACRHLYIDNAWRVIGDTLGRLYYMPDVVIEHLHPAAGKAEWDEGHLRVNAPEVYDHDSKAFDEWLRTSAVDDIERVREALGG